MTNIVTLILVALTLTASSQQNDQKFLNFENELAFVETELEIENNLDCVACIADAVKLVQLIKKTESDERQLAAFVKDLKAITKLVPKIESDCLNRTVQGVKTCVEDTQQLVVLFKQAQTDEEEKLSIFVQDLGVIAKLVPKIAKDCLGIGKKVESRLNMNLVHCVADTKQMVALFKKAQSDEDKPILFVEDLLAISKLLPTFENDCLDKTVRSQINMNIKACVSDTEQLVALFTQAQADELKPISFLKDLRAIQQVLPNFENDCFVQTLEGEQIEFSTFIDQMSQDTQEQMVEIKE